MPSDLQGMRILIFDSDPVGRRLVRRVLAESLVHQVIGEAADAESAIALAGRTQPDVVLLAQTIASDSHGLVPQLVSEFDIAVILTAITGRGILVWRGMNDGASGYLLRDRITHELAAALAATEGGGAFISPPLVRQLVGYVGERIEIEHAGPAGPFASDIRQLLLPREQETLRRLAGGQSTTEIARQMSVSTATVRAYVSRILRKLNLESRGGAIALAYRSGFYSPYGRSPHKPVTVRPGTGSLGSLRQDQQTL